MKRSFWALIAAQCQVFLNDNAAKLMLMVLAIKVLPPDESKLAKSVLAVLIIFPLVLLAPFAGWLADRFSKRDVLYYAQWMQFVVMIFLTFGLLLHSLAVAILCLLLLGIQCAIFAPTKQAIIKEIVGTRKLSTAVGWVEASAIASILLGNLAGGRFFDANYRHPGDYWHAGIMTALALCILAGVGVLICKMIERTPSHSMQPFRVNLFWQHFVQMREVLADRPTRLCILGNAYFYALAGALFLSLLEVSDNLAKIGPGMATMAGTFMTLLGVGVILGNFLVSKLTKHQVELGLIPIGTFGLICSLLALGFINPANRAFSSILILLGLSGALFVVPLNAYLQENVDPTRRGRILSVNNLVLNLAGTCLIFVQFVLSSWLKLSPSHQFLVYAIPSSFITAYVILLLPENLLRFSMSLPTRLIYRVLGEGAGKIPVTGGVLLLPNHISYIDAIILQLACPRPIRFLIDDTIYRSRWINWGLKLLRTIPISSKRAKSAIDAATEALKAGEVVCIFPEGALTRTATLIKLNRGYELIARKAQVPIVLVWLENLWGSVFSFYGGIYFWKLPRALHYHVWVYFGSPMTAEEATQDRVRRDFYDLSEHAFSARPELRFHVGRKVFRVLKRKFFHTIITDAYQGGKSLKGGTLLAVSLLFSFWLKRNVPEKRVGIILPPGLGATIANLACVLADKTAVNFNFTAGRAANESAIKQSGVKSIISAQQVIEKFKDFPWPKEAQHRIDLSTTLKQLPKWKIVLWQLTLLSLPVILSRWIAGIPRYGDHEEVALLFTSGSAGDPKGVVISHRNLLANTAQIGSIFASINLKSILGSLPVFHSFGFTVMLWWPLFGGPRVTTYANPLETQKLLEIISENKLELLVTTPTFLRSYLKKGKPDQLKSVKFVVTGAEKLPPSLAEEFYHRFGVTVCEGYGMTEATPVVSTNLPDILPSRFNPDGILGRKIGSVGRLLPGLSPRITDPETDAEKSIFESGMLWLRGSNIFDGYLNDPSRTNDVLKDGWYRTGDIARLDQDGFLYIEGRLSRFSKIGGEMVPHGTVEQKIMEAKKELFARENAGFIVVGIPDEAKGEALVILSTEPIDLHELRPQLIALGLPNLWIPKSVKIVETIPLLATGKIDLKACEKLAKSEDAILS